METIRATICDEQPQQIYQESSEKVARTILHYALATRSERVYANNAPSFITFADSGPACRVCVMRVCGTAFRPASDPKSLSVRARLSHVLTPTLFKNPTTRPTASPPWIAQPLATPPSREVFPRVPTRPPRK